MYAKPRQRIKRVPLAIKVSSGPAALPVV
jgi:hypothetical protein